MNQGKKLKIILAKMGLDCHDTGITTMAAMLRDRGYEIIYLGLHNSAERILNAAIEEDADVIGLSFLSGQQLTQTGKLLKLMKEQGVNIPVILGGVIPKYDIPVLKEMGVAEIFTPGTMTQAVVDFINEKVG